MTKISSRKVPVILVRFNENWIFSIGFRKIIISNFMKIRPVGAELFQADGRTDRHDEADSRFTQFCECAYNGVSGRNHINSATLNRLKKIKRHIIKSLMLSVIYKDCGHKVTLTARKINMRTWKCELESKENCLVKEHNHLINQHRWWWWWWW